jgi:hypothetical protein
MSGEAEAQVYDSILRQGEQALNEVASMSDHVAETSASTLTEQWRSLPQRISLKTVEMLGRAGIPANPLLTMRVEGEKVIFSLVKNLPRELVIPITWEGLAVRAGVVVLGVSVFASLVTGISESIQQEQNHVNYESVGRSWR